MLLTAGGAGGRRPGSAGTRRHAAPRRGARGGLGRDPVSGRGWRWRGVAGWREGGRRGGGTHQAPGLACRRRHGIATASARHRHGVAAGRTLHNYPPNPAPSILGTRRHSSASRAATRAATTPLLYSSRSIASWIHVLLPGQTRGALLAPLPRSHGHKRSARFHPGTPRSQPLDTWRLASLSRRRVASTATPRPRFDQDSVKRRKLRSLPVVKRLTIAILVKPLVLSRPNSGCG